MATVPLYESVNARSRAATAYVPKPSAAPASTTKNTLSDSSITRGTKPGRSRTGRSPVPVASNSSASSDGSLKRTVCTGASRAGGTVPAAARRPSMSADHVR